MSATATAEAGMRFPENYSAEPHVPVIRIYSETFELLYEYAHPALSEAGGTAGGGNGGLSPRSWTISQGTNANAGSASVIVEDPDNELLDADGALLVRDGHLLEILLGRPGSAIAPEPWFFGVINNPVQSSAPGVHDVSISAYGYGDILKSRHVTISHEQRRDEVTGRPDGTDASACVSALVRRLFDPDVLLVPPADPLIELDVPEIDVKVADLRRTAQSQSIVLQELANISGCVYGIRPDRTVYFHSAQTHGGLTASAETDLSAYDPDGIMVIRRRPYRISSEIIRKAYTSMIASNLTLALQLISDGGGGATATSNEYQGIGVPSLGAITTISILARRAAGSRSGPVTWNLREYDTAVRRARDTGADVSSGMVSADAINALDWQRTQDGRHERAWIPVDIRAPQSTADDRIIWLSGDTALDILYQPLGGPTRPGEPDERLLYLDGGPEPVLGRPRLRALGTAQQTQITALNLNVQHTHRPKEQVQRLDGTPQSETAEILLEGLMDRAGRRREVMTLETSLPSRYPRPGTRLTIRDPARNIDRTMLLIGMDVESGGGRLHATSMTIECEEFS